MLLTNKYLRLAKIGRHYALTRKEIKRGWIDSVMQGRDIIFSRAYEISKALGRKTINFHIYLRFWEHHA
ncbi:MAG: hypothetical protein A2W17_00625 [Planctomycetes bacterium RBG_16_41_13]|nr:MAG: hypothetical protein A2W17_00625 [Planctomycetes bacterium RBG_16_41_13]